MLSCRRENSKTHQKKRGLIFGFLFFLAGRYSQRYPPAGAENAFWSQFYTKNDQFTKTGSGQT
jgi:hypothetical protein